MAFPNISDILATTIENRSKTVADNVTKNNALLGRLKQRGKIKTFSGGHKIYQELSFAENGNGGWYSGYDLLSTAAQDVISAAEFNIKQYSVPTVMSGLEMLQNAGKEKMIDLMEARLEVAEATLVNAIAGGIYSDPAVSLAGAKGIDGLGAALPAAAVSGRVATGTYGNISRAAPNTFWRHWYSEMLLATFAGTGGLNESMNTAWSNLVRGMDRPDLIVADNTLWNVYVTGLQALQRFSGTETAGLGFPTIKFMDADVVLDGGIGGFAGDPGTGTIAAGGTMYFLNTNYLFYRPHAQRNVVALSPNKRYAMNQDAEVQILAWAGNMTCSGLQFQGRVGNAV